MLSFYQIFFILITSSVAVRDDFKHILLHLKPHHEEHENVARQKLQNFIDLIDKNFNESNITAFYEFIKENETYRNFVLSLFHNWGLGVKEDQRIAVLRLNLGVLEEDHLSFLSFNYKSLNGLNIPKGCQANLVPLKLIVNSIAHNFSLFERKEGIMIYVNRDFEFYDNELVNQIMSNLDEIRRTNPKQLFNFIEYYLSSSVSQTPEMTRKIVSYLEEQMQFSRSPEIGAYLGMLYLKSEESNSTHYENARRYLEKAAKDGFAYAYLGLGVINFYGLGMEINYTLAFDYFLKANNSAFYEATTYLGICYLAGLGVVSDSQKALKHIMMAANKGYLLALYILGFMHEKGIGVFYSCRYAAEVYSIIIEHKLMKSHIYDAVRDYRQNQILKAFFKFLVFSEMGSSYSLVNAAHIAEKHKLAFYTDEKRFKKVFRMWKQAASLGNPKATIKLGDCYFYGIGTDQDYKDAFENYQTAALLFQEPEAMFNLGYMYEYGLGIKKNYNAAERFYSISSKFDKKTKTLISLVLLKIRMKNMFERMTHSMKALNVLSVDNYFKMLNFVRMEFETIVLILFTFIAIILTKIHINDFLGG